MSEPELAVYEKPLLFPEVWVAAGTVVVLVVDVVLSMLLIVLVVLVADVVALLVVVLVGIVLVKEMTRGMELVDLSSNV
ncbi:hypothetical protein N7495_000519 [Penicillium taxi]|uniref:uncharacterized protein n=1 Tax=Penicillium taxi TaxID=168475 RepID=UPI0025452C2C|nr:uncharacterized protein N7495_000519 [Penicillium taxi]KAJ5907837.1 hypothetical protein N7495_000519 [Penicillium taxi]